MTRAPVSPGRRHKFATTAIGHWPTRARFGSTVRSSDCYVRPLASLYRRSTSPGMRPRVGTAIPLFTAHARIVFGSRLALARRDDLVGSDERRLVDCPFRDTGRLAFQYLSTALDKEARFFFDKSSSRHSPFHPSRTVSTPSDPSRSSTNTSTVAFAIATLSIARSTLSEPPAKWSSRSEPNGATERYADAGLSQRPTACPHAVAADCFVLGRGAATGALCMYARPLTRREG